MRMSTFARACHSATPSLLAYSWTAIALFMGALACGCSRRTPGTTEAPGSPPPGVAASSASAVAPSTRTRSFVWVKVEPRWVATQKPFDVTPAEARAWAQSANSNDFLPSVRHVLVKSDADPQNVETARIKAEALLARLKRGEDWSKVAHEASDDPGSKDRGGVYDGETVSSFVPEFQQAYLELAPGTIRQSLLRTEFGWHVLKKDPIDERAKVLGYRAAKRRELAETFAKALENGLKAATEAQVPNAIEQVISQTLGPAAANAPGRPVLQTLYIPVDSAASPCTPFLEMTPGDVTVRRLRMGLLDSGTAIVVRAMANAARNDDGDNEEPAETCKAILTGLLTTGETQRLMQQLKSTAAKRSDSPPR